MKCNSCGFENSGDSAFCESCGAPLTPQDFVVPGQADTQAQGEHPRPKIPSLISKAERILYFNVARAFAWCVLAVVALGMIGTMLYLLPSLRAFLWTSNEISSGELNRAIENRNEGRAPGSEPSKIDPAKLAKLDEAAYEVVSLLPPQARRYQSVDSLRASIKSMAANVTSEQDEQLDYLHELASDLRAVPSDQRAGAMNTYFSLKTQKIQEQQSRKVQAKTRLLFTLGSLIAGTALMTLVVMFLVLLAIERNTRRSKE